VTSTKDIGVFCVMAVDKDTDAGASGLPAINTDEAEFVHKE
jgi:hypothetical protein